MKRKIIVVLLALLLTCCLTLTLNACKNDCSKTGEHTWDEGIETTPAKCDREGVKKFCCVKCGEIKTEPIEKLPHTPVTDPAIPSTCLTGGKTEGSHCGVCGEVITAQTTTNPGGHSWDEGVVVKAATCIEDGVKVYKCKNNCGETKQEPIEKTNEHVWDEGTVTKAATCMSAGLKTLHCKTDGCSAAKADVEIPKNPDNHVGRTTWEVRGADKAHKLMCECGAALESHAADWNDGEITAEETCETDGKKLFSCHHTECTLTYEEVIDNISGHLWDTGEITKDPTCTEDGERTFRCQRTGINCQGTKTEPITKSGHAYSDWTTVTEATCTTQGTKQRTCSNPGCSDPTETEYIPILGHSFNTQTWLHDTAKGTHYHKCVRCDERDAEAVHDNDITLPKVDSTCTEAGKSEGKKCSVCDYVTVPQTALELARHEYSWQYDASGNHWQQCANCSGKTSEGVHELAYVNSEDIEHYKKCRCGYIDETTRSEHNYNEQDGTQCVCGKLDTTIDFFVKFADGSSDRTATTLQEAVNKIGEGQTGEIVMSKPTSGAGVVIDGNRNVTIRMNGQTYTATSGVGDNSDIALLIKKGSSLTLKNGEIRAADDANVKSLVVSYADKLDILSFNIVISDDVSEDAVIDSAIENALVILNGNVTLDEYSQILAKTKAAARVYYDVANGGEINFTVNTGRLYGYIEYGAAAESAENWTEKASVTFLPENRNIRLRIVGDMLVECDKTNITVAGKKVEHLLGEGKVTTEPTCHSDGVLTRSCVKCYHDYDEAITTRPDHSWDIELSEITTAPTCTTAGVRTYYCTSSGCDEEKTEAVDVDPTAHNYSKTGDKVIANCHTVGVEIHTCEYCNSTKEVTTVKNADNHDGTQTWTQDNMTHALKCAGCNATLKSHTENFSADWTIEDGKHYRKCMDTECTLHGEEHAIEFLTVFSSVEVDGNILHVHKCMGCDLYDTASGRTHEENFDEAWTTVNGKHVHKCLNTECTLTSGDHIVDIDTDWTEEGGKHFHKCLDAVCSVRVDEHDASYSSSWSLDGETLTHYHACTVDGCGMRNEEAQHTATYEYYLNGVHKGTCSVCEQTVSVSCDSNGEGGACSVCGNKREGEQAVKVLTFGAGKNDKPVGSYSGSWTVTIEDFKWNIENCNNNNNAWSYIKGGNKPAISTVDVINSAITKISINYTEKASTCTTVTLIVTDKDGKEVQKTDVKLTSTAATIEIAVNKPGSNLNYRLEFNGTANKSITINSVTYTGYAMEHLWGDGEITKPATCTEDGVRTYTCSDCGEVKTEAIPAAHTLGEHAEALAPNCATGANGYKEYYKCSECGLYFSDAALTVKIGDTLSDIAIKAEHTIVPVPESVEGTIITLAHFKCSVCNKEFFDEDGTREVTEENRNELIIDSSTCDHAQRQWEVIAEGEHIGKHANVCVKCGNIDETTVCAGELVAISNDNGTHTSMCELCDCEITENCDYTDNAEGKCNVCQYKGLAKVTLNFTGSEFGSVTLTVNTEEVAVINGVAFVPINSNVHVVITVTDSENYEVTLIKIGDVEQAVGAAGYNTGNLSADITITVTIEEIVEAVPVLTLTADSISKIGSGSGYAPYNGEHIVGDFKFETTAIMPNAGRIQCQKANGILTITDTFSKVVIKGHSGGAFTVTCEGATVKGVGNDTEMVYEFTTTGVVTVNIKAGSTATYAQSIEFYA